MDSFELNKILGAILGTLLFVMGVGFVAEAIYAPAHNPGPGFDLPAPDEQASGDTGTNEPVKVADIGTLLAAALAAVVLVGASVPFFPRSFLPPFNEGTLTIGADGSVSALSGTITSIVVSCVSDGDRITRRKRLGGAKRWPKTPIMSSSIEAVRRPVEVLSGLGWKLPSMIQPLCFASPMNASTPRNT